MTYLYFFSILVYMCIISFIESKGIRKRCSINYAEKTLIFVAFASIFAFRTQGDAESFKWAIYCLVTCFLLRCGWYDFLVNKFSGRSLWYIKRKYEESLYDRFFNKIGIHPHDLRGVCFVLSIIWLLLNKHTLI